jgi:hypothetical protein
MSRISALAGAFNAPRLRHWSDTEIATTRSSPGFERIGGAERRRRSQTPPKLIAERRASDAKEGLLVLEAEVKRVHIELESFSKRKR